MKPEVEIAEAPNDVGSGLKRSQKSVRILASAFEGPQVELPKARERKAPFDQGNLSWIWLYSSILRQKPLILRRLMIEKQRTNRPWTLWIPQLRRAHKCLEGA
jgi:hypothetical protein